MKRSLLLLVVAIVGAGMIELGAQAPAPAAQPATAVELKPNDYKDDKSWLCRPGRKGDACDVDDDNDGMPDVYEQGHPCLSPLGADASA